MPARCAPRLTPPPCGARGASAPPPAPPTLPEAPGSLGARAPGHRDATPAPRSPPDAADAAARAAAHRSRGGPAGSPGPTARCPSARSAGPGRGGHAAPRGRGAPAGQRPGGRSVRLPAPARRRVWSAAAATHALPACLAGQERLCAMRLTGLRVAHGHWASRPPGVWPH